MGLGCEEASTNIQYVPLRNYVYFIAEKVYDLTKKLTSFQSFAPKNRPEIKP